MNYKKILIKTEEWYGNEE